MDRWGGKYKKTTDNLKGDTYANSHRVRDMRPDKRGKNKRTTWDIPTKSHKEVHFAIFPEKLVKTPIKAGCPLFVCSKCGIPKEKMFDTININDVEKEMVFK